ncbi:uncharacterized protein DS421_20g705300 [Arachis hypogaea]|nr:uncharacterized protein DS421_20g705300 [Arachis hypogaea]
MAASASSSPSLSPPMRSKSTPQMVATTSTNLRKINGNWRIHGPQRQHQQPQTRHQRTQHHKRLQQHSPPSSSSISHLLSEFFFCCFCSFSTSLA